jgi:hypothetical protein
MNWHTLMLILGPNLLAGGFHESPEAYQGISTPHGISGCHNYPGHCSWRPGTRRFTFRCLRPKPLRQLFERWRAWHRLCEC